MIGRAPGAANLRGALGTPALIGSLGREGGALAAAAAQAGLDALVPTCPGWRVRDLLRHLGGVHRWAAAHVEERLPEAMAAEKTAAMMSSWPADAMLLDWFHQGHRNLTRVLEQASPDLDCWTFLPAPSPLGFWARRQAHETGIHRVDAEAARGAITPFEMAVAVDGIEEMLFGFASRRRRLPLEAPRRLGLSATDSADQWLVQMGATGVEVSRGGGASDCHVADSASNLFLLLWNRHPGAGLEVKGDRGLLVLWRESIRVRWG